MDKRYPRTLFRGDETCVVASLEALQVKAAQGWVAKPLAGDGDAEAACYGVTVSQTAPDDVASVPAAVEMPDVVAVKRGPDRPRKVQE